MYNDMMERLRMHTVDLYEELAPRPENLTEDRITPLMPIMNNQIIRNTTADNQIIRDTTAEYTVDVGDTTSCIIQDNPITFQYRTVGDYIIGSCFDNTSRHIKYSYSGWTTLQQEAEKESKISHHRVKRKRFVDTLRFFQRVQPQPFIDPYTCTQRPFVVAKTSEQLDVVNFIKRKHLLSGICYHEEENIFCNNPRLDKQFFRALMIIGNPKAMQKIESWELDIKLLTQLVLYKHKHITP